jgi:hypothetical protein
MKRWLVRGVLLGVVVLLVLQVVPIGRIKNGEVTQEAPWPDAESKQLAVAACYDCHSNEVQLKWFDKIAPVSWYVANHVNEGRDAVNFSEWDRRQDTDDLAESVEEGDMPLSSYTALHPTAKLSAGEKQKLVAALEQLGEGGDGGGRRGRGGSGGDDG